MKTSDAVLAMPGVGLWQVEHAGVLYHPSEMPMFLGALLFALSPRGVHLVSLSAEDRRSLETTLLLAQQCALVLHRHANRKHRSAAELPAGVSLDDLRYWVEGAIALCPAEQVLRVQELMARQLGPNPWCVH